MWKSRSTLRQKLEGTFHLGGNFAYPASLFLTVVAVPVMILRIHGAAQGQLAALVDSLVFVLMCVTQVVFYVVATRELHTDWVRRLKWLPFFPLVGVGLAVNNARGVMEALTGLRTEFVRTPKLGVFGGDADWSSARADLHGRTGLLAGGRSRSDSGPTTSTWRQCSGCWRVRRRS